MAADERGEKPLMWQWPAVTAAADWTACAAAAAAAAVWAAAAAANNDPS